MVYGPLREKSDLLLWLHIPKRNRRRRSLYSHTLSSPCPPPLSGAVAWPHVSLCRLWQQYLLWPQKDHVEREDQLCISCFPECPSACPFHSFSIMPCMLLCCCVPTRNSIFDLIYEFLCCWMGFRSRLVYLD